MIIQKKKIINLKSNMPKEFSNKKIIPCVVLDINTQKDKLKKLGFSDELNIGETLLPSKYGPITKFNSEGKYGVADKSKPKKISYREISWRHEEWAGKGRTRTVEKVCVIPYKSWYKPFINPPSVEIIISKKEGGKIYITSKSILVSDTNEKDIVHQINIFLEIFNQCDILSENLIPIIIPTKRLNWKILPSGKRTWSEQKKLLEPLFNLIKDKRTISVIESRLEDVNSFNPDDVYIGQCGFSGYVVFGFSSKNIYILESALYGNAIYVFNENWEELSKKTKEEILNNKLQITRITHNGDKVNIIEKIEKILK